jgi:hypothetical protein
MQRDHCWRRDGGRLHVSLVRMEGKGLYRRTETTLAAFGLCRESGQCNFELYSRSEQRQREREGSSVDVVSSFVPLSPSSRSLQLLNSLETQQTQLSTLPHLPYDHTQLFPSTDPSLSSSPPHIYPINLPLPTTAALLPLRSLTPSPTPSNRGERMPRPPVFDQQQDGHGASPIPSPDRERGRAVQPEVVKCVYHPLHPFPSHQLTCFA